MLDSSPAPAFEDEDMMAKLRKINGVPPVLPIIWQDWDSDPDTQRMTVAEEGFFFRFLRKQWVLGELPADPWRLSRMLNSKYETRTGLINLQLADIVTGSMVGRRSAPSSTAAS